MAEVVMYFLLGCYLITLVVEAFRIFYDHYIDGVEKSIEDRMLYYSIPPPEDIELEDYGKNYIALTFDEHEYYFLKDGEYIGHGTVEAYNYLVEHNLTSLDEIREIQKKQKNTFSLGSFDKDMYTYDSTESTLEELYKEFKEYRFSPESPGLDFVLDDETYHVQPVFEEIQVLGGTRHIKQVDVEITKIV